MQGTETAFEWALLFYFHIHFWDLRSHGLYGAAVPYIYKIGCLSVVLSICKSFPIVLSVTSPYSVYVVSELSCTVTGWLQRFSIPVIAYPRSAHFVHLSYHFRCLYYSTLSSLRSEHHIFRHDSSSNRTYMFHSKGIEVCETWIEIVLIYRGILCHTSRFSSKFRLCVKMLRCANPWINVPKWSKLQPISPAQGVGSNGHSVGRDHVITLGGMRSVQDCIYLQQNMSIGTHFMHRAHF